MLLVTAIAEDSRADALLVMLSTSVATAVVFCSYNKNIMGHLYTLVFHTNLCSFAEL